MIWFKVLVAVALYVWVLYRFGTIDTPDKPRDDV